MEIIVLFQKDKQCEDWRWPNLCAAYGTDFQKQLPSQLPSMIHTLCGQVQVLSTIFGHCLAISHCLVSATYHIIYLVQFGELGNDSVLPNKP